MWKTGSLLLATASVLFKASLQDHSVSTMPSSDSEPSVPLDHSELISVLTELYVLLDTLSAIPSASSDLPPPDTGVHPPSDFDADGALAAGFSPEAVRVLSMIPYPAYEQEIEPRTTALSYLGMPGWDRQRALIYG